MNDNVMIKVNKLEKNLNEYGNLIAVDDVDFEIQGRNIWSCW